MIKHNVEVTIKVSCPYFAMFCMDVKTKSEADIMLLFILWSSRPICVGFRRHGGIVFVKIWRILACPIRMPRKRMTGGWESRAGFYVEMAIKLCVDVCMFVLTAAVEDYARDRITDTVSNMELRPKSEWSVKLFQLLRLLSRFLYFFCS